MNTQTASAVIDKGNGMQLTPPARELLEIFQRLVAGWRTTAASSGLTDVRVVAAALFDDEGKLVLSTSPMGLANLSSIATEVRRSFPALKSGQTVITNDPAAGGRSVQTFYMARRSTAVADFTLILQFPTVDFGGETLGDFYPAAREVWAEGARVSPCLFADELGHDGPLLELLGLNSRIPLVFSSDVLTAVECLARADSDLAALAADSDLHQLIDDTIVTSRALVADLLPALAESTFEGSVAVDPGCGTSASATVTLSIRSQDGDLKLDFSQSEESPESYVNSYLASTRSAALLPLAVSLPVPLWNQSLLDSIVVLTEAGSVVDARLPRAAGWAPYGVARAIAGLVSKACGQSGAATAKWAPWVADPIFRFVTPHCVCERCEQPSRRDPEDYASMYVPSLIA